MQKTILRTTIFLGFIFAICSQKSFRVHNSCDRVKSGECHAQVPVRGPTPFVNYDGKGDINLIFAVPHNGALKPVNMEERKDGCKVNGRCRYGKEYRNCRKDRKCKIANVADAFTQEIAILARKEFKKLTGQTPHLVINNLYRAKMDPNRPKEDAAQGDELAERAFHEYHGSIEEAKDKFEDRPGLLIDFHGQAHESGLIEVGYLVTRNELRENSGSNELSIRSLVWKKGYSLDHYLFGSGGLGAKFGSDINLGNSYSSKAYRAVPSPSITKINKDYYRGGYSIARHSSNKGGNVDAIQLEFPKKLRYNRELRKRLAKDVAINLYDFFYENYYLN